MEAFKKGSSFVFLSLTMKTSNWKPIDEDLLEEAWEEIRECAEAVQKDLGCPDETIAKMFRSVAATFDDSVEEILDKEEASWE